MPFKTYLWPEPKHIEPVVHHFLLVVYHHYRLRVCLQFDVIIKFIQTSQATEKKVDTPWRPISKPTHPHEKN